MTVINRPSPRRAALLMSTTILAGGLLPIASAHAAGRPPVLQVTLNGQKKAKISGTKGLKAGWATFHIVAKDGLEHVVVVDAERHPASKAGARAEKPPQSVRRLAPHTADDPSVGEAPPTNYTPPSPAEVYASQASAAREGEKTQISLGGADVIDSRGVDLTVLLPAGTIYFADGLTGVTEFKVAKGTNSSGPGHADATVSEGSDNVIHSPATLPRDGVLRIINSDSGLRQHSIMLARLVKGATKSSIEKWFAPSNDFSSPPPFTGTPVTGFFDPLSAGHSQYTRYHKLKPGKYALIDAGVNSKNGHVRAEDGAIRFVTVK